VTPERIFTSAQISVPEGTNRFNEGAVDPEGRYLAGTMGHQIGEFVGKLYACEEKDSVRGYTIQGILEGLTCTNGMDWSKDGKTM
jgi:sugar lactone lactonase YvrE